MRQESLDFLIELANTPSPPGREQRCAEVWCRYLEPYAQIDSDQHGNSYAILNPEAEFKIMLAGHVDEIAFIVHYIDEAGLLYFKPVGGHDPSVPVGQRVWVHGPEQIPGVIGRKPFHLQHDEGEDGKGSPKIHEMWIDVGAKDRSEAERLAPLGTAVTYQQQFQKLQHALATGRSFDNKLGAFCVAETIRLLSGHEGVGIYGVATVQEEIGFRGATTAANRIQAQVGLAVDVSHATDYPGISKERHGSLELGKGPAITLGAYASPVVSQRLIELAPKHQIEVAAECTGTDATPMQVTGTGMAVGIVGIPLRYMHTPCEVVDLDDVEATVELMAAFCREVGPNIELRSKA